LLLDFKKNKIKFLEYGLIRDFVILVQERKMGLKYSFNSIENYSPPTQTSFGPLREI